MLREDLGELITDPHAGVKRRHRILIDHRDLVATDLVQLLLAHLQHIVTTKQDASTGYPSVFCDVIHNSEG